MKKLTLNPDLLQVQSFVTSNQAAERGTVHAEQQPCTCHTNCTCPGCPSCGATCPATCWETCDDETCATCGFSCGYDTCNNTCNTLICACNQSDFGSCIC